MVSVGTALAAIKVLQGIKDSGTIQTIAAAAGGNKTALGELAKKLSKYGDMDDADLTTIAKAATSASNGGSITDAADVMPFIEEIGMDKPADYVIDAGIKALSNVAKGVADWQRIDANALVPVLLRKAERRAESPYSHGLVEDMFRNKAAKYAKDKEKVAMIADRVADTVDSTYGRYRADKDYVKSQKMAHINPMSGNRSLAEQRRSERLWEMLNKGTKN